MKRNHFGILLVLTTLMAACAPASPAGDASRFPTGSQTSASSGRTLSILLRVEPVGAIDGADDRGIIHKALFSATLGGWDEQAKPYPMLAASVPQLDTDTWRVFADGKMETMFRLRPGSTWHDGAPFTAEDWVFTARSEKARVDWGISATNAELRQIDEIVAPDPMTVLIRWRQPFTEAAAPQLIPVARHLLAAAFEQGEPDFYGNQAYWTNGYVGTGPFRLDRWELGSLIEGSAFESYALGRPKVDRVRLTWNNDPTVSLTRLLSGDADMAAEGALRFEQANILRDQWKGVILLSPTSLRYVQFQARPEFANPRLLLDLRARQALYHAIDRAGLAEAMVEDRNMVADTYPPPTVPYYAAVDRTVTKYPFDARRAEQLLAELGFGRGNDGAFTSATEGRLRIEVRGVSGGQEEHDTTIVASQLRERGVDNSIMLLPSSARAVDDRTKGTFPGLTLNNNTLARRDLGLDKFITARIGGPHDNWVGGNRMGWSNPDFDRLFDTWTTSLDPSQRTQRLLEMIKLLSDELPALPLYYNFQVVAHTGALRGPLPISPETTRYGNAHQWAWQ